MKQMFVRAYCQGNLGDDLFVLQLVRKFPGTRFYLYALGENQNAFREEANLVLPTGKDRFVRKLTHSLRLPRKERFDGQGVDGVVVIGGSILWENADVAFSDGKTPCFLIGANCDAQYSDSFRRRLRDSLALLSGCCFRDSHSYGLFRELPNVTWAPDVLFDWKPSQPVQPGEGIGISVVSRKGCFADENTRQRYYDVMARVIELCRAEKIPVSLLGFCRAEGDGEAMEEIRRRTADPEYAGQYLYSGDPEAMLDAMNSCRAIIATRFHAMILGWVLGKNVVPVIYSEKQTQVLRDSQFTGPVWNALEGEAVTAEALLEAALADTGRLDITDIRQKAQEQFAALDAFLHGQADK